MSRPHRPLPAPASRIGGLAALLAPLMLATLAACQPSSPPPASDTAGAAATADAPATTTARADTDAAAALHP